MSKYFKVTLCRVENTIYVYDVKAKDEASAENKAWKLFNDGEPADVEDVVHAEEFTHQVEAI